MKNRTTFTKRITPEGLRLALCNAGLIPEAVGGLKWIQMGDDEVIVIFEFIDI